LKALLLSLGALSGCDTSSGPAPAKSGYAEICKVEAWDAEITLTIVGSPSNVMDDGSVAWEHQIELVSSGEGTFDAYPDGVYSIGTRIWKMIHGQVNAPINEMKWRMSLCKR
jgi:hypothetical protein